MRNFRTALLALATAATFTVASTAVADAPLLTVTPASDLKDGQSINYTVSGFPAGAEIYVGQCETRAEGLRCNLPDAAMATVGADGSVTGTAVVRAKFDGRDPNGETEPAEVSCTRINSCLFVASSLDLKTMTAPVFLNFAG